MARYYGEDSQKNHCSNVTKLLRFCKIIVLKSCTVPEKKAALKSCKRENFYEYLAVKTHVPPKLTEKSHKAPECKVW